VNLKTEGEGHLFGLIGVLVQKNKQVVVLAGAAVLDEVRQAPNLVVVKESIGAATETLEQGGRLDRVSNVKERTAVL
jgi:hypothetical protein